MSALIIRECDGADKHTFSMNSHRQEHLILHNRAPTHLQHEIIFAVNQRNMDKLESELISRSTPESSNYQEWLTFDEVGEMTSNPYAATQIKNWLLMHNATVTWESIHSDYIKATAPILIWESLFNTEFFEWEDKGRAQYFSGRDILNRKNRKTRLLLAKEYTIPILMREHMSAAFNTVQPPPMLAPRYHMKDAIRETSHFRTEDTKEKKRKLANGFQGVTVPFLNSYYKIQSNKGNVNMSQAVFETSNQKYSPNDVTQFQTTYNLIVQAAIDKKGQSTTNTCFSTNYPNSNNPDCYEGNLDIQYIMGVAQKTTTTYWYDGTNNAFLSWILAMSNTAHPPLSNSISWGTVEQVILPAI